MVIINEGIKINASSETQYFSLIFIPLINNKSFALSLKNYKVTHCEITFFISSQKIGASFSRPTNKISEC
jgi:hypothetical protein